MSIKLPRPPRGIFKFFLYALLLLTVAVTGTVWVSGDSHYQGRLQEPVVNDITQLNPVRVDRVVTPKSIDDIVTAIRTSTGPISIGGGHFSMGGQTAKEGSLHLDMRQYDKVVAFSPDKCEITVESGITWHKIQQHIDPHDLSVKIMQTYSNFTVGGSLSVNVHGRYIGHGPLISSVKSIRLVLADGSQVEASPKKNPELFYAAIGGYGGIGVITEATLMLDKNEKVERKTSTMKVAQYRNYFAESIRDNRQVVFHNADIYPPAFENVRDVSWYVTDKPPTIEERLIPADRTYFWLPKLAAFASSSSFGKWFREHALEPMYYSFDRVVRRNWEASYDVRELGEGDRSKKTYVLQEYFIPVDHFDRFVPKMRAVFQAHDVDVLNVSVRHALPDPGSYLAWAREEVFAFVVYYCQGTTEQDKRKVGQWTREMTDAIVSEGGTYYLPYQPHATIEQFRRAYPHAEKFFAVKRKVDPQNRFQNKLWEKYYPSPEQMIGDSLTQQKNYQRGEEQTFLSLPEWYLVFNPNEYAAFLDSGKNPSDFPFFKSIDEYWTLYDRVKTLTNGVYPKNSKYQTMLWVIGVSTTAEYLLKGIYENTLGRLAHWTASRETPEEALIRDAHRAYAKLIYDKPWYKFPFWAWAKQVWTDAPFFGQNFIRKTERKIFFTLEFGFKALYAKLIGFGAQTAYEPSDGLVTMHVRTDAKTLGAIDERIKILKDFGNRDMVVTVPRWGAFTEIVPKMAVREVEFVRISGNDDILVTATTAVDAYAKPAPLKFLFTSVVMAPEHQKRMVYVAKVAELAKALRLMPESKLQLEHIYDY
jgi:FAD/FMN-containing dehydrogenase